MQGSLYLAVRYLRTHLFTSATLVATISLTAFLPLSLEIMVQSARRHFRSRAESTPLVVGPKGSSLQLVLSSLYFDRRLDDVLEYREFRRISDQVLGETIPLHRRYEMGGIPIVGTTRDYFSLRRMSVAQGEHWKLPGECIVGAEIAKRRAWSPGARVSADAASAFLLDHPPLRLHVVGVLRPTETPDDHAVFVSLSTAWILDGLGHGHAANQEHGDPNAALYTDITADNADSFHFHGDQATFPLSSVIILPKNERAGTLLQGQYLSADQTAQIVQPSRILDSLLAKVVMVRSYVLASAALLAVATTATIVLVISLSIRLRKQELETMRKIGCSRRCIAAMLTSEILILLAASGVAACLMTWAAAAWGPALVRWFLA